MFSSLDDADNSIDQSTINMLYSQIRGVERLLDMSGRENEKLKQQIEQLETIIQQQKEQLRELRPVQTGQSE